MEISELEEGQKVLFNDRKKPLEVVSIKNEEAEVEGPNGASYILYRDGETDLVARKGKKRYSSYLENLRTVGEWIKKDDKWIHTKTEAEIKVKKQGPVWMIELENADIPIDQPKYGFTDKKNALEKAKQIVGNHPEGKTDDES